ncbi:MAG: SRPBCC family protein, partial [Halobacteriaceae archaeon]
MESVSVSRQIDGSIESISSAIHDVKPFMKAAGFDEVIVDGSTIIVANQVGPIHIELTLKIRDVDGAALFYEQID